MIRAQINLMKKVHGEGPWQNILEYKQVDLGIGTTAGVWDANCLGFKDTHHLLQLMRAISLSYGIGNLLYKETKQFKKTIHRLTLVLLQVTLPRYCLSIQYSLMGFLSTEKERKM